MHGEIELWQTELVGCSIPAVSPSVGSTARNILPTGIKLRNEKYKPILQGFSLNVQIEIGDLTSEKIEGDALIEIITILGLY